MENCPIMQSAPEPMLLTHWGRVTHICVSKLTIIGSDNGLSPDRRQAIIWTNDGILSIRPLRTKLSEILMAIHIFSFKKMHLKMSSGKWRPCCLGLNVLSWDRWPHEKNFHHPGQAAKQTWSYRTYRATQTSLLLNPLLLLRCSTNLRFVEDLISYGKWF